MKKKVYQNIKSYVTEKEVQVIKTNFIWWPPM